LSTEPVEQPPPAPRAPLILDLTFDGHGLARVAPPPRRYGQALLLFLLTLFTTTTLGANWVLLTRSDVTTWLPTWGGMPILSPAAIVGVWSDPALLARGLLFSVPLMLILLAHELGHYLFCRHYGVPATPPYFLPLPFAFGTLGAFIRIQAPIRDKRSLFDIGVGGPLAGFALIVPVLLLGVAWSKPVTPPAPVELDGWVSVLPVPGKSLALELATRLFHGPLPEGTLLDLHPFALAGWFGLLATAFNLLPIGQLDGGHLLYALLGRRQARLSLLAWLGVALLGFLVWEGWLVWCLITLILGIRHPPVLDEAIPLDPRRKAIAALALLILVLSFTPNPLEIWVTAAPEQPAAGAVTAAREF
jgi:Zn-dependent protease